MFVYHLRTFTKPVGQYNSHGIAFTPHKKVPFTENDSHKSLKLVFK